MDVPRKTEIMHSDSDWVNNHFWKRGNHILHKLLLTRDQGATIYLYGDGHIPDFWMYNIENHHGVMTGMIGEQ